MKTIGPYVLFSTQGDKALDDEIALKNGVKLWMDTVYDPLFKVMPYGTIEFTNEKLEEYGLKKGVRVYCHHFCYGETDKNKPFVSAAQDILGQRLFTADLFNIYAIDEGLGPKAFGDSVFVSDYRTANRFATKTSLILPDMLKEEVHQQIGTIEIATPEYLQYSGLKIGDKVIFSSNSEYEMLIGDRKLFRMEGRDIVGKLEDEPWQIEAR